MQPTLLRLVPFLVVLSCYLVIVDAGSRRPYLPRHSKHRQVAGAHDRLEHPILLPRGSSEESECNFNSWSQDGKRGYMVESSSTSSSSFHSSSSGSGSGSDLGKGKDSGEIGTTGKGSDDTTSNPTASEGNTSVDEFNQAMLDAHNAKRALHDVDVLIFDPEMASRASSWSHGCKFKHNTVAGQFGQNLAAASGDGRNGTYAIDMWYTEGNDYDYKSEPDQSKEVLHFTQMVWKDTKAMGCAIAQCADEELNLGLNGEGNLVVCNYKPAGNQIRSFRENVVPPKAGGGSAFKGTTMGRSGGSGHSISGYLIGGGRIGQ